MQMFEFSEDYYNRTSRAICLTSNEWRVENVLFLSFLLSLSKMTVLIDWIAAKGLVRLWDIVENDQHPVFM
jgi:hypothetical protein